MKRLIKDVIYHSNIEEPTNLYEERLLRRDGEICKVVEWLGNGFYLIEFNDGQVYEALDDELEFPDTI